MTVHNFCHFVLQCFYSSRFGHLMACFTLEMWKTSGNSLFSTDFMPTFLEVYGVVLP